MTNELEGWWYIPGTRYLKFFTKDMHFGWDKRGQWVVIPCNSSVVNIGKLKPANERIVVERVKKELEKRGYHKDVTVQCLYNTQLSIIIRNPFAAIKNHLHCLMHYGEILSNGAGEHNALIMDNGQWAEILNKKPELLIKCL